MQLAYSLSFAVLLLVGCHAVRPTMKSSLYVIVKTDRTVTVDGELTSTEWGSAQLANPVQITSGAGSDTTTIRLLYDDEFLYISVHCVDSQITVSDPVFSNNDSLTFLIKTGVVETDDSCRFHFAATPQAVVGARFHQGRTPYMRDYRDVTKPLPPDFYQAASFAGERGWSAEIALSWSAVRPPSIPPSPFWLYIERRDLDGQKISVSGWPYDSNVDLVFESGHDKKERPNKTPGHVPSKAAADGDL